MKFKGIAIDVIRILYRVFWSITHFWMFYSPEKYIPKDTLYCYTPVSFKEEGNTWKYTIDRCPFHKNCFFDLCMFNGTNCEMDYCKMCGISMGWEYDEEDIADGCIDASEITAELIDTSKIECGKMVPETPVIHEYYNDGEDDE